MMSVTTEDFAAVMHTPKFGWMANVIASWTIAGGAAGGLLMALLVTTSRVHVVGAATLIIIVGAFGATLGAVHGAILGYLGRPVTPVPLGWRGTALLAAVTMVAAGIAVGFALWFGVSAVAATAGAAAATISMLVSTAFSLVVFAWATVNGWHALERAYTRWPEKRLGTMLVVGASAVLSSAMLLLRGTIPGTEIKLSAGAAVVMVVVAVLWIVSPVVFVMLRLTARIGFLHPHR